uniref:Uncharacterized protein AlNc14C18G1889 n=1 Tax=Albugo laibachii Nc14 TaxID=890382 RepID=F0W4R8_9STRA|nr:conserved hypothetical protein [Albugo laibachii Nc14]|eukprot:CCA16103.1 conserved hypothetical protein [Albugo laibachii Nc14]
MTVLCPWEATSSSELGPLVPCRSDNSECNGSPSSPLSSNPNTTKAPSAPYKVRRHSESTGDGRIRATCCGRSLARSCPSFRPCDCGDDKDSLTGIKKFISLSIDRNYMTWKRSTRTTVPEAIHGSCHSLKARKGVTYAEDGSVVNCRFCDILLLKQKTEILYEDAFLAVFRPLTPLAATHILVVPRCHIRNVKELTIAHRSLLQRMRTVGEYVLSQQTQTQTISSDSETNKFAFHLPPFNSIDHVHMHAFRTPRNTSVNSLHALKYCTETWWCQSYEKIVHQLAA